MDLYFGNVYLWKEVCIFIVILDIIVLKFKNNVYFKCLGVCMLFFIFFIVGFLEFLVRYFDKVIVNILFGWIR